MKQKTNKNLIDEDDGILSEITKYKKQMEEQINLQKLFDFPVPSYLLSELKNANENLFSLINLAKLNHRISNENAEFLKRKLTNHQSF